MVKYHVAAFALAALVLALGPTARAADPTTYAPEGVAGAIPGSPPDCDILVGYSDWIDDVPFGGWTLGEHPPYQYLGVRHTRPREAHSR
ncbi:MAG: hypothetical protein R3E12_16265 [Candidatus Eisenbacteria bacterium]|uniref:Uncharacterized protein n=1 Tax=Eiseniibacteriota bacterium TaxID=2212470 RepID=A0A956M0K9_UNCEI|nr:hypothetical protein [Candidatus Eisenbacteria bacterium]